MQKTMDEIKTALAKPFSATDVEWRIQHATKDKSRGFAVPYLRSRAIQVRLDEVVGPYNWKPEYKPWHTVTATNKTTASQLCGLSVFCEARGEWIQKWDGAENTDIEAVKGGISDSFKRAAVLWGIGRYLYSMDGVWVDLEEGKSIKKAEYQRLNNHYEQAAGKSPSNVTPFPTQQSAPTAAPEFDYAVSAAEQREFKTGTGMALTLQSPDGNRVEAFLQRTDANLVPGICLKNVKLTKQQNGNYSFHIMYTYQVA
jgi:hypothetical protein